MNNLISELIRSSKKTVVLSTAAVLVVSGFFISNYAFAAHTATVTVLPGYVAGGSTDTYTFNITNTGADSIYQIVITAPGGFTINNDPICPSGWLPSHAGTSAQCLTGAIPTNPNLLTVGNNKTVSFSATAQSPGADTKYTWTVDTTDNAWGSSQNTDAKTIVDVTKPNTSNNAPTGWQGSNVTVTLNPNDNFVEGVPGSGVANTYYCVDEIGMCDPVISGTSIELTCSDGSICNKSVKYYSVDNVGNSEVIKPFNVRIDKSKPVTSIVVDEPKYSVGTPTYITSLTQISLDATDDGVGTIALTEYKIGDGVWTPYAGSFPVAGAGPTPISYRSTDSVGNIEDTKTLAVFVDNTPPIVGGITIEPFYTNGTTNYISVLSTLSAFVNDDGGSGVASCEYTLNGNFPGIAANYNTGTGVCSINGVPTSAATSINIQATDNIGNVGAETAIAVTPDTTKPVTTDAGTSADWQNVASVLVTLTPTDDGGSGAAQTFYCIDADNMCEPTTNGTSVVVSDEGKYYIRFKSIDNVGNEEIVKSAVNTVKIDRTPPTIDDDAPEGWLNTSVDVTLSPEDTYSGIDTVKYCGGEECDPSTGDVLEPSEDIYQLTYSDEGVTVVKYQVWDNAGNYSVVGSFTVQIDLTDPEVGISSAPEGWTNETQTATVICSDEAGTVNSGCNADSFKYLIYTEEPEEGCSGDPEEYNLGGSVDITQYSWVCSYAKDVAGNEDFSGSPVEFKVDQINPTGQINDDIDDAVNALVDWQNTNAEISLSCSDVGGSECSGTMYYGLADTQEGCDADTPYSAPVPISSHQWFCYGLSDNAGNSATANAEIKVDPTAPTSEITSPDVGSWFNNDFNISVTDIDEGGSELNTCSYEVNGGGPRGRNCNEQIAITVGAEGDCGTEGKDTCSISIKSTDIATNESEIATRAFSIDWTDPTVDITSPIENDVVMGVATIAVTVGDNLDSSLDCEYDFDGGEKTSIACIGDSIDVAGIEGRHTLNFYSTDDAGNTNFDSVEIVVNNDGVLTVGADADFSSIQAAIDAATAGDTISVVAGTYTENIDVNKSLTLTGASSTTVTVAATNPAVSVFNVTASSVSISGFTVTGANISTTAGIYLSNDVTLCNISDNILTNNGDGIWLGSGSNHNTLENNTLSGNYQGFEVYHSDYNTFTNNIANSNNVYGFKMEAASHNTFIGNTANSNAKYGFYFSAGSTGSNNNMFTNNTANSNTEYGIRINSSDGNMLTNNTFDLNGAAGSRLKDTITNLTLDNNSFTNSPIGIDIASGAGSVTSWTVGNNNISGNTINVSNGGTGTLNAASNWWGTAVLATIQSKVTGTVTVTPYYIDAGKTTLSSVIPTTVYVNSTYKDDSADSYIFGYNAFATIQEGINAVAIGETVNVAAGTYAEDLIVNVNNLSLLSTVKHGAIIKGNVTIQANGVTLDGFKISNFSQIPTPDWSGVYIPSGTGITVANNLIDGTDIDPVANLTVGIHTLYGATAGATLKSNIVRNVRMGIYNQGAVLLISKNTIEDTAHCAIGVDTNLGTTITENTISNSASLGIEVFGANVVANFNNITGSANFGVWSAGPQVDAIKNWWGQPTGPVAGQVSAGVDYRPWCTEITCTVKDLVAPTTVIISSTAISPTKTSPIPIIVTSNEPVYDFAAGDITVSLNATVANFSGVSGSTSYTFDLTPNTGVNEGDITVSIAANVAWDASGNYNTAAAQYSITYDSVAPTATITDAPASLTNVTSVDITVGGTDVVAYKYKLETAGSYGSEIPIATHITLSSLADGVHNLYVIGRDAAGNWQSESAPATATWTIDTTAPTATLSGTPSSPTKQTSATITIGGEGVTYYRYKLDSGSYGGQTAIGTTISLNGLLAGAHTISVIGRDEANNWQLEISATPYSWTIDLTAPIVLSHVPTINAVNVEPDNDIVITFSEAVVVEPGDVTFSPEITGGFAITGTDIITINPANSLGSNTNYTITLSGVTDLAGNIMANYSNVKFTTATHYDIPLYSNAGGWNLISLPVVPNGSTTSAVLGTAAANIDAVWAYDPTNPNTVTTGGWLMYAPGDPAATNNLTQMTTGYGYWISATANTNINGWGSLLTAGPTVPPSRDLNSGWNLIGYYQIPGESSSNKTKAFSSLGATYTGLWGFDNVGGVFRSLVDTILPGDAFWISLPTSKIYTPSNIQ